jgi:predicted transposase/invertase (TIGR01784 family)
MITDPVFYRLFKTSPETFFLVLGMPVDRAREMAGRYQYEALEFKETAYRTDGVFCPKEAGLPLYFLEVQFYLLKSVFADVMVKAFTYLKQHDPNHQFQGVVLFASRGLEPQGQTLYQPLFDAGFIKRYYLDEMPVLADAPLGMSILQVIQQAESEAPTTARNLIARTKKEIEDEALRANLIELLETIIMYKLPRLNREEIQAMLQVHDIRQSRVYQEALEEGMEKERRQQFEKNIQAITKMAALKIPPEQIAEILGLDVELVREKVAKKPA